MAVIVATGLVHLGGSGIDTMTGATAIEIEIETEIEIEIDTEIVHALLEKVTATEKTILSSLLHSGKEEGSASHRQRPRSQTRTTHPRGIGRRGGFRMICSRPQRPVPANLAAACR